MKAPVPRLDQNSETVLATRLLSVRGVSCPALRAHSRTGETMRDQVVHRERRARLRGCSERCARESLKEALEPQALPVGR